jgi:hypothetical protein
MAAGQAIPKNAQQFVPSNEAERMSDPAVR